jgi:hypothetical protein
MEQAYRGGYDFVPQFALRETRHYPIDIVGGLKLEMVVNNLIHLRARQFHCIFLP